MPGPFLRKYGQTAILNFQLYQPDGIDLCTNAVHASGDTVIMRNEGAEANTTNAFVDEGRGYSLTLTAAEMQAARIVVYIADQTSPKAWLDTTLVIETYGHASAQHAFDLDTASAAQTGDNYAALTTIDNFLDTEIAAILADTNELQTDWANGGRLDVLLDAAAESGHGAGALTFTYALTSSVDSSPIPEADVWITSDLAGLTIVASGRTNAAGNVTFYLDAGTYYVWRQKTGWNFTNPDTEVVA